MKRILYLLAALACLNAGAQTVYPNIQRASSSTPLTSGRLPYVTVGGRLADISTLLFDPSTGALRSGIFTSLAADVADAGVIRLGNGEVIAWEASPGGGDITFTVNSSEQFVFSGGILLPTLVGLTLTAPAITTPTAQTYGATLTVDVTLPLTTVSLTGNCTETFSATPTTGTRVTRQYTADGTTRTIIPDNNSGAVYFNDLGTTASSFTVAANSTKTVIYERQSARWAAYMTGVSTVGTASSYVLGTATFLFDTHGATWDGAGSVLTTGKAKGYFVCPYAATISGYNISVDTGTATFTVWKVATGTAVPTVANLINTSGVAISTGTNLTSTTVSDFTTTAVAAGDILAFNLTAVSGVTQATFTLKLTKL